MTKGFLLGVILLLVLAGNALPQTADLDVQTFIKDAGVSLHSDFTLEAPLPVWESILDHPYLVGKLWETYRFWPRYDVKRKGSGIRVEDPSRLEGDVFLLRATRDGRVFYGTGRIHHWAVPEDTKGRVLFVFSHRAEQGRILGRVDIYLAGDRDFARFLLKVGSFVLRHFIEKRFRNNLKDMQKILTDITKEPERVRDKLREEDRKEFDRVFPRSLPSS
jgi:hypothetical protein